MDQQGTSKQCQQANLESCYHDNGYACIPTNPSSIHFFPQTFNQSFDPTTYNYPSFQSNNSFYNLPPYHSTPKPRQILTRYERINKFEISYDINNQFFPQELSTHSDVPSFYDSGFGSHNQQSSFDQSKKTSHPIHNTASYLQHNPTPYSKNSTAPYPLQDATPNALNNTTSRSIQNKTPYQIHEVTPNPRHHQNTPYLMYKTATTELKNTAPFIDSNASYNHFNAFNISYNQNSMSEIPPLPVVQEILKCSNCGVDSTPLWRKDHEGKRLCNPCGLYFKRHKVPRRLSTIKNRYQAPSKVCYNCKTTTTTLWRRSKDGWDLCNACGVYYRCNHKNRPLSLSGKKIISRKPKKNNLN